MPAAETKPDGKGEFLAKDLSIWRQTPGPGADAGAGSRIQGYQWWTRDDGTFNALGIHGQHIHIDPARRMVIAVNSAWPAADFTTNSLAARTALFNAIRAAIDSETLPNFGR